MDVDELRQAAERVGDRWTLLLVAALLDGPRTFGELESAVGGISPAVLSSRLKGLEADGLVVAAPYQQRPVRHRYELTGEGRDLEPVLLALAAWAGSPLRHAACGTATRLRWWCPTCEVVVTGAQADLHRM